MPDVDLAPIEAVAQARVPRLAPPSDPAPSVATPDGAPWLRLAPLANLLSGPVFSRARDIIAANMTELLDRAEDPARTFRVIILEMEETLVEIRATAARTIADMKEMGRALTRLVQIERGWTDKAELALARGRDDLARAALAERGQATDMADGLRAEIASLNDALKSYEADIARLQGKLREARARQASIASRFASALARARVGEALNGSRVAEAFARFAQLDRRADLAEGIADALAMTGPKTLAQEFAELSSAARINSALDELKTARAARQS